MVSRPREEPPQSLPPEAREGFGAGAQARGVVFMTDPSAEAERAAQALRASGYVVLDVPLALLPSRVAVQRPDVVVVDAEAESVREVIARLRALPGGQGIDLIFLGALGEGADDLQIEASGVFRRPVNVSHVVRKIQALLPLDPPSFDEHLTPPPSLSASLPQRVPTLPPPAALPWASAPPERAPALSPPPRRPAGRATSRPPSPGQVRVTTRPPSSRPSPAPPWASAHETLTNPRPPLGPRLSDDLRRMLDEAEERLDGAGFEAVPAPEDEVDAVLPPELLEALDEPLEVDETFGEGRSSSGTEPGTPVPKTQTGVALLPPESLDDESVPSSTVSSYISAPNELPSPAARPTLGLADVPTAPPAGEAADWRRHAVTLRPPRPRGSEGSPDSGPWPPVGEPSPGPEADPDDALTPRSGAQGASRPSPRASPRRGGPPPSGAFASAARPPPSAGRTPAPGPRPAAPSGGPLVPPAIGSLGAAPPAEGSLTQALDPDTGAGATPAALEAFGPGESARLLGRAVAERRSMTLCFEAGGVLRRAVLRDGDFVMAGSGAEDETLVAFLASLGEIPRGAARRLEGRVPPFGRHAGAALVARGHVAQDRLWAVLRGHAEWVIGRIVAMERGHVGIEPEPPRRYQAEPSVFGGSAGAEVFVDVVRRVVAPPEAIERLGGERARVDEGPHPALLGECALSPREQALCEGARGASVGETVARAGGPEFASLLWALALLGVVAAVEPPPASAPGPSSAPHDALDEQALRERVRARLELVEEGDYFAMLGVSRAATSYDLRRAYLELRRSFEPSRLLTAATADLAEPLALIRDVLDEAYDILRDPTRRERYRRAIEGGPPSGPRF
ncbi:MAG TPA: hypothetical protein VFS43_37375 [Polyangiaceae bacterium]|nr:hypothetical protein [Polyangiaceae bacterium]